MSSYGYGSLTSTQPPAYHQVPPRSRVPGSYDADPEAGCLPDKPVVLDFDAFIRNAFISKVYAILTVQLVFTTIVSLCLTLIPSVRLFVQNSPGFLISAIILSFLSLFGLMWYRYSVPANFAWLSLFTLCEAWLIGSAISFYNVIIVCQALCITIGLFALLSAAAMYAANIRPDWDLSNLGTTLSILTFGLFISGFIGLFLPFGSIAETIYCILGVIIFSGLVVYDTWRILSIHSPEDYIAASLNLYLDIINLFLFILRFIGDRDGE